MAGLCELNSHLYIICPLYRHIPRVSRGWHAFLMLPTAQKLVGTLFYCHHTHEYFTRVETHHHEMFMTCYWLLHCSRCQSLSTVFQRLSLSPSDGDCVQLILEINRLTPNDPYMGRTALLTSKRYILYIYSTNIGTEYFKHALYSPFFSLQNAVCFKMLTCFLPVLFIFCIQDVLKLKKNNSGAKGLTNLMHKIFFYNKLIVRLYMFRAICAHLHEVKIVLCSIWYHHTCRWPFRAQVESRLHIVLETFRGV